MMWVIGIIQSWGRLLKTENAEKREKVSGGLTDESEATLSHLAPLWLVEKTEYKEWMNVINRTRI